MCLHVTIILFSSYLLVFEENIINIKISLIIIMHADQLQ